MYHIRPVMYPIEKYLLIKFCCDYADEFDVEGFTIWKESEWIKHFNHLKENKQDFPAKYNFGSNKAITFNSPDEFLSCCNIKEISKTDFDLLNRLFRNGSYGELPTIFIGELDWSL